MDGRKEQKRRYFLGANWKCNGTTYFVKDIVTHLINSFSYDNKRLGTFAFDSRPSDFPRTAPPVSC